MAFIKQKINSIFLVTIILVFPFGVAISLFLNESGAQTALVDPSTIAELGNDSVPYSSAPPLPLIEEWAYLFGTSSEEQAPQVIQCSDGSFAFVGRTRSPVFPSQDAWLVRTSSAGSLIWQKTFGGYYEEYGISVVECSNGDFAIAGYTESWGPGDRSVWLLRTDSNGNHLWNQTYGGSSEDVAVEIIELSNDDFLLAGYTQSFGGGNFDCWAIRTDSSGNHIWNRTYGGAGLDQFRSVQEVSGGGFIFGGECEINQVGNRDMWLVKTDVSGVVEWNSTFGGSGRDRGYTASEFNSGYALFGTKDYTTGLGDSEYWLIVTDSAGIQLWDQTYGGFSVERAQSMIVTADNGFALFGYTYSIGQGGGDFWLVRTDSDGDILDTYAKGGSLNDYGRTVAQCDNGDLILIGVTYSYGAGDWDAWLIRLQDIAFHWDFLPTDQIVGLGDPFLYDLDVVPDPWVDMWRINDTTQFSIDSQGIIRNTTVLGLGNYGLQVWVNDTFGTELNANFTVKVAELDEWTVLVYLDGDNDLEDYAFSDLNSLETVWPTEEVRVIVYVDFWSTRVAPYSGARCYEVTNDSDIYTINSNQLSIPLPSEPNMGDWRILRDFIVFGQTYAPSDKYLLVLWDHGMGYEAVCIDDTNGDYLSMREVNLALSDPQVQYLDIVAFDACMMGQLEVAYELRDVTDYVVFSEEGLPLNGFPYEDILANLTSHPTSSPLTVAEGIPYYYTMAYDVGGQYYDPLLDWVCLSTVDTSQLQDVVTCLHLLGSEIYSVLDSTIVYERVCIARVFAQGFTRADFVDLGSFATALSNVFSDSAYPMIQTLARDLRDAVQAAIVREEHLSGVPGATGLAVVLNRYYDSLDLADDTIWDVFMDVFTDVGSNRGTAIGLSASGEYFGYLDWADDSFYYQFDPLVTGLYTFYLDALMLEYSTDFDLYLYDEYNEVLASSTSSDSSESFTVFLEVGSTYYIEVYSYPGDSDGVGVFQLTVQQGVTTPPQAEFWVFILAAGIVAIVGVSIAIMVYMLKRGPPVPKPPPRRYTHPPDTPTSQRSETMQFCAYCGALLPSQAQYCPACGASV